MRIFISLLISIASTTLAFGGSPLVAFNFSGFDSSADVGAVKNQHEIRGLLRAADGSMIVFTESALLRSMDRGETWEEIALQMRADQVISSAVVGADGSIVVLLGGANTASLELLRSDGDALSWSRKQIHLPGVEMMDAVLRGGRLTHHDGGEFKLRFVFPTSSNFTGIAEFASADGGSSWQLTKRDIELRTNDEANAAIELDGIRLSTTGKCLGFKTGCFQESRLTRGERDVTPPIVKQETQKIYQEALAAVSPMFTSSPGGSTRISLNRGFDKCTVAPVSQMQAWWDTSWFYDTNIYMSGRNRGCTQALLNAAWVKAVSEQGWGLIPTIVGYQSPCINSSSQTIQKHSIDPATAETQGRGEADIAIADANALGLTQGTVLYYDMERYDETAQTPGCRTATVAFLKGWTERVRELGYISGTYGSPRNAIDDWQHMPPASRMDAVWMARWDNIMSVWTYLTFPDFPTNVWANHQRIKQWQAPHNETWGGFTFNIDGNISDAPVAGPAVPKNKNADFDGDGRADISIFRPDNGAWFILFSSTANFSAFQFGTATDILAPGDYDGDGKTDAAIFRPADGTWHILPKGNNYRTFGFGTNGDIPAAGDYNGDGKTDPAVFRPSNGVWFIANSDSQGTYTSVQFGAAGDQPVPADFDGDGKTNIAIYRPTTGVWYVLRSSDGGVSIDPFGLPGDLPAQGDYDGDGKTDLAVFRPSEGVWYLFRSTAGFTAFQFGIAGDVPSTGDFDGDGTADVAIFRPSSGIWYILRSTGGVGITQFGLAGDISIPSTYLPQ